MTEAKPEDQIKSNLDIQLQEQIRELTEKQRKSRWKQGFQDFIDGSKRFELWTTLAFEDLKQRYWRTGLGIVWVPISYTLFLTIYIIIFGRLAGDSLPERVVYMTTGLIVWQYISSAITEGASLFIGNAPWLKASKLPYSVFAFQGTIRLFFHLLFSLGVSIGVLLIFREGLSENITLLKCLSSAAGLALIMVNIFSVQIILGIVALRYRDLIHFINSTIRLLFFVSPVIWEASRLGPHGDLIKKYNVITYFIDVVRSPLVSGEIHVQAWVIVITTTISGLILAPLLLSFAYRRIPFWI